MELVRGGSNQGIVDGGRAEIEEMAGTGTIRRPDSVDASLRPPFDDHVRRPETRLFTERASCPALAGEAMTDRDPHRFRAGGRREFTTAARGVTLCHQMLRS